MMDLDVIVGWLIEAGVDADAIDLDACIVIGCAGSTKESYIHREPESCRPVFGARFDKDHRSDEHHEYQSRRDFVLRRMAPYMKEQ